MKFVVTLFFLGLSACASLHSVSTSSIPAQRGRKISAMTDKFVFMGFNFSNEYVDAIVRDLSQKCPNGKVEGILTKQESINYFLYIFWTSRITASGYCVGGNMAENIVPENLRAQTEVSDAKGRVQ